MVLKSSKEYSVKSILPPTSGHRPNTGAARTQLRPEVHPESSRVPPALPPPPAILHQKSAPYVEPGIQLRSRLGRGHPFHLLSAPPPPHRLCFFPSSSL